MTWTKLTDDPRTWPERGDACWVRVGWPANAVQDVAYDFSYDGFCYRDTDGELYTLPLAQVTHWAPATPPPFEEGE